MLRHSKPLFHKDIIATIKGLTDGPIAGTLTKVGSSVDGIESEFKQEDKNFKVAFNYDRFRKGAKPLGLNYNPKGVTFKTEGKELLFESIGFTKQSPGYLEGRVNFFYTKGYSKKKKSYYRLIFPLSGKLDFHNHIEQVVYESDLYSFNASATKAIVSRDELLVYTLEDKSCNQHYFGIESEVKQDFETFSEKAFALKNAIGYLTGYLAGDNGYFFSYGSKKMENFNHYYFCTFRNTIKSHYNPVNTNPFSLLYEKRHAAEKWYGRKVLEVIPIDVLSNLADKLFSSIEFAGALVLIMESSIASLLFMPGGFAIVLETMADLIIGEDKLKLSPIKDKPQARALRKKLMEVVDAECSELPEYDYKTLKIRVDLINNMTNGARLRAPFNLLGITLNEKEVEILEARNDFLHGRMPDIGKTGISDDLDSRNRDLYYAAMRFYTLLSLLILRWSGFKGHVVNYPKMSESYLKIKIKEPYFRV